MLHIIYLDPLKSVFLIFYGKDAKYEYHCSTTSTNVIPVTSIYIGSIYALVLCRLNSLFMYIILVYCLHASFIQT